MSKKRKERTRQPDVPAVRARVKKKKRKRFKLDLPPSMVYALGITAALVVVVVMSFTLFFNISQADIQGCELYTYDQVIAMSGVSGGTNLLRMNTDTVEKRLVEGLPYVEQAKVTKRFPDSIDIEITEAEQGASLEQDGRYVIISTKGVALETDVKAPASGHPVIKGFEIKPDIAPGKQIESKDNLKAKIVSTLMSALDRYGFEKVSEIDLTDRTNIVLRYDDRLDVYIGSSYDMEYKLEEIKAVIDKGLKDNFTGVIRYNGTESGISAIPEGAAQTHEKVKDQKKTVKKTTTDDTGEDGTDDTGEETNSADTAEPETADPDAAAEPDAVADPDTAADPDAAAEPYDTPADGDAQQADGQPAVTEAPAETELPPETTTWAGW